MIYFVTYAGGRHAVDMLLAGWGRELSDRIRPLDYRTLFRRKRISLGSYVFTGLEQLSTIELEWVAQVWMALRKASSDVVLCNHPLRVLRRYPFLRVLYEEGLNPFNVYRLDECRRPQSFPVFLRRADDHTGPQSRLLDDHDALEHAVNELLEQGICLNDWIITEFTQTRCEDGLYRKYGAFLINGQVIPRHLLMSRQWMVKGEVREIAPETVDEEWVYVQSNPHAAELQAIFQVARIDFGRIDYTVHQDKISVFEINTNPQILTPGESRDVARRRVKRLFAERFTEALRQMARVEHPKTRLHIGYGRKPLLKRRPKFTEMGIRLTNSLGLRRFEPNIYRFLVELRKLWR